MHMTDHFVLAELTILDAYLVTFLNRNWISLNKSIKYASVEDQIRYLLFSGDPYILMNS